MIKKHGKVLINLTYFLAPVLVVAAYLPGLPGDFLFDDLSNIVSNTALQFQRLDLSNLVAAMFSEPSGSGRPLSMLTFALNAHFLGMSPFYFKLINILIHVLNGLILLFISREVLHAYNLRADKKLTSHTIHWLSLAASLAWLLHPLNLTAVLYVVQRDTSLSAMFSLASVLVYLIGRRRQKEGRTGALLIWLCCPLFIATGIFCKENAALVPVFLFVIEFTLLRFRTNESGYDKGIQLFFVVFLLLPSLATCYVLAFRPGLLLGAYATRDFTLYERLLTESRVILDYLRWAAIPDIRQLGFFHDDIALSTGILNPASTLPCVIAITLLFLSSLWLRNSAPLISFGILWFFAGHLMESGIFPLELVFEHRNYMPLTGLILGVIASFYIVAQEHNRELLAKFIITIVIILFAGTTALRASEWRSALSFAQFEAKHHPDSARAQSELAWSYEILIVASGNTSLIPAAVAAATRSKELDRKSINQDIGLARMFMGLADYTNASLYYRHAAEGVKSAAPTATNLLAIETLFHLPESDTIKVYSSIDGIFRNALSNPVFQRNACYIAGIWSTYGLVQEKNNKLLPGLSALHKAVSLCPTDPLIRLNYAITLLNYGDTKDSRVEIDALMKMNDLRYSNQVHMLQEEWIKQNSNKSNNE